MRHRAAGTLKAVLVLAALLAAALAARPAPALHFEGGPTHFVTLSDGTSIALTVVFPKSFDRGNRYDPKTGTGGYPTIFEMAGYENGSTNEDGTTMLGEIDDDVHDRTGHRVPGMPARHGTHHGTGAFRYDEYVVVHAQVRGTGCSSGEFDLFSWRTALDGYEIIEGWIVRQPWSNRKVGIVGHSYSGNTGFMVAAAEGKARREGRPSHLVAVSLSAIIDDIYRGIVHPGGILNSLFPALWPYALRPAADVLGGTAQGILRNAASNNEVARQCAINTGRHSRAVFDEPVLHGTSETDNEWFRSRSNVTYAHLIDAPMHITGAFQDEQTGPRFPHLWEMIPRAVPKRLLLTNGDHGTQVDPAIVWKDRKAWMDYWMRGEDNAYVDPARSPVSVRTLLELHRNDDGELVPNGIKDGTAYPREDTRWTPFHLARGAKLSPKQPAAGSASYVFGTKRQSWSYQGGTRFAPPPTTARGSDELDFVGPAFRRPTLMDGPITANLFVGSTATNTELFVQVADRDPDGNVTILQRGMLRASHRAINPRLSDWDRRNTNPLDPSRPFLYRPWRPHMNPTPIEPRRVYEYLVEVFPVAHVFRPGHRLQIKIMTPPAIDSFYGYVPGAPPGINTVYFGKARPSRITVPLVSLDGVRLGPPLGCGEIWQVRCVRD